MFGRVVQTKATTHLDSFMDLGSPLAASKQLVITLIAACLVGFAGILYYLHIQSVNNRLISQYNGNVDLAIHAGDLKAVKQILEMSGNQPGLGFDLNHALRLSIDHTNLDIIQLLIEKGANPNEETKLTCERPLDIAIKRNQEQLVRFLLSKDVTIDYNMTLMSVGSMGGMPLNFAVELNEINIVQLLLDRGASLESTNIIGDTPLHTAASKGNLDMVTLLVRRGAKINAINKCGLTPLAWAWVHNHKQVELYLLANGGIITEQRPEHLDFVRRLGELNKMRERELKEKRESSMTK